jgi:hypothetical protein
MAQALRFSIASENNPIIRPRVGLRGVGSSNESVSLSEDNRPAPTRCERSRPFDVGGGELRSGCSLYLVPHRLESFGFKPRRHRLLIDTGHVANSSDVGHVLGGAAFAIEFQVSSSGACMKNAICDGATYLCFAPGRV